MNITKWQVEMQEGLAEGTDYVILLSKVTKYAYSSLSLDSQPQTTLFETSRLDLVQNSAVRL